TMSDDESLLGADYAKNKGLTFNLLAAAGLPVGRYRIARTAEQAVASAEAKGVGVRVGLGGAEAVRAAAAELLPWAQVVVVQSVLAGDDHRLLVVDGRFVAGARREPAAVIGDGARTVAALIEAANRDPRRGAGFTRLMNRIEVDDELRRVLASAGLTL